MNFMHTMIRISDIDESLKFFCGGLGLQIVRRADYEGGRYTLIFLASPQDMERAGVAGEDAARTPGLACIELTYNWPDEDGTAEDYSGGRNFGHIAYYTDDIYARCQTLMDLGVTINRPPRDGRMAFIRSPDGISVELIQRGDPLPIIAPWKDMDNIGQW